ncbi:S-type anion channel SLAH3 [Raphanus sativus]|uniref:S-type anion channel SLAH3 n=1 Tax=Raphanus sativus TaxID=3726 RepID=A0A9W3DI73_RAPSA|nr:S-type anion channel SLAH3 [Raphanus sativus]KAJ4900446.1 S-type anion channel SLAH3 [Raphanus sativus]
MEERSNCVQIELEEELPALLRTATTEDMVGFDNYKDNNLPLPHFISRFHPYHASTTTSNDQEAARSSMEAHRSYIEDLKETAPWMQIKHQRKPSLSMPTSPNILIISDPTSTSSDNNTASTGKSVRFISQPMAKVSSLYIESGNDDDVRLRHDNHHQQQQHQQSGQLQNQKPAMHKLRDHRYTSFKTWSGKLERQFTRKPAAIEPETQNRPKENINTYNEAMPVDRYYDALEGPELETLRPQEEIVLPSEQTWPFLLRYPISTFGMCLGVSSQAIMWKTLATAEPTKFLHVPLLINEALWFISVALIFTIAIIYLLKIILYFEAVRREYYHPIRINFFFAPFISFLFLALGVPPSVTTELPQFLWYLLMFPFICLELKIYGQWMSGGQRRLSRVANPTNHLSIVGNFVGALLGASMGLREGPIFFYAVGMAHYLVLFVTLYQRLPTNETLPKDLHPVFFLFVAAPSVASMAWAKITGSFDYGSKVCYFIAIFLYFSLAVRINFFRGIKFSLSWWAYTFPMTGAAIATIRYATVVRSTMTQVMCVILCAIATLVVSALLVTTIIHVFVLRDLFPNDYAIAISNRPRRKQTSHHRWLDQLRNVSSENIENFLKFTDSDSSQSNDLEAGNGKIPEDDSA